VPSEVACRRVRCRQPLPSHARLRRRPRTCRVLLLQQTLSAGADRIGPASDHGQQQKQRRWPMSRCEPGQPLCAGCAECTPGSRSMRERRPTDIAEAWAERNRLDGFSGRVRLMARSPNKMKKARRSELFKQRRRNFRKETHSTRSSMAEVSL
jgi:hypothetical protein